MTNEQKALEIAKKHQEYYDEGGVACKSSLQECFDSALKMAEWKDKEFEYILSIAFETIGEQNGHCSKDLFEYLDVVRKLLKDSSNQ